MNNNREKEKIALFAGTFDPYTIGHHRIVERALQLFDRIVVAIGVNSEKRTDTGTDARIKNINSIYRNEPRVEACAYEGLTVDFARKVGAQYLLRGIRNVKDFEYERDLADINLKIGDIETVFLVSEPQYAAISSSVVRELIKYNKDVSNLIP